MILNLSYISMNKINKINSMETRTLIRYTSFQVPSLVLLLVVLYFTVKIVPLSSLAVSVIIALWIVKDILLYPFLRRYYRPPLSSPFEALIGKEGSIHSDLNPEGYISIGMELWRARPSHGSPPLKKGVRAVVTAVEGFTLYVKEIEDSD